MTQDALSAIEQETAQTAAEYFAEIMSTFNQTVQEEADKGRRSALLATSGEFDGPVEELEPAAAQAWARVSEKLMALGLKIEIVKNDGTEREYGNYELMVRW
jgi:ribosomal protein S11